MKDSGLHHGDDMTTKAKKEEIRLVLPVSSSDGDYNADCDYAFVRLTKNDVKAILKYRDLFEHVRNHSFCSDTLGNGFKLSSLVRMEFWDNSPRFFSAAQETPEDCDFESCHQWMEVPETWKPDDSHLQRTECGCVTIWQDHIRWTARVKHVGIEIETGRIEWDQLEKMLKELKESKVK